MDRERGRGQVRRTSIRRPAPVQMLLLHCVSEPASSAYIVRPRGLRDARFKSRFIRSRLRSLRSFMFTIVTDRWPLAAFLATCPPPLTLRDQRASPPGLRARRLFSSSVCTCLLRARLRVRRPLLLFPAVVCHAKPASFIDHACV